MNWGDLKNVYDRSFSQLRTVDDDDVSVSFELLHFLKKSRVAIMSTNVDAHYSYSPFL